MKKRGGALLIILIFLVAVILGGRFYQVADAEAIPVIKTDSPSNVAKGQNDWSAKLNATLLKPVSDVSVWFSWGQKGEERMDTEIIRPSSRWVSYEIDGLKRGVDYEFKAYAENEEGIFSESNTRRFNVSHSEAEILLKTGNREKTIIIEESGRIKIVN